MQPVNQDLHIHTKFSKYDSAVAQEQTIDFVAKIRHANVLGISDHLESFDENPNLFDQYLKKVKSLNMYAGTEVDGSYSVEFALSVSPDYYIYHCFDTSDDYRGAELLLETGKPVIIAHPMALGTNLKKVPAKCLVEINNRYVWRGNWEKYLAKFTGTFKFVLSSDAHQPNWLNQVISFYVASQLGIKEQILFPKNSL